MASSTDPTRTLSSPETKRCRFDIGPSNASMNHDLRGAIARPGAVGVIQRQRAADAIAVVEDDRAPRVGELRERRMADDATVHAVRLTREPADGVEVVDRVIRHFEPSRRLEERPEMPWLIDDDAYVDVEDGADRAARKQIAERQDIRAEAQLKIDRRSELTLAARGADRLGRREILSHRLLHQDRRPARKLVENLENLIAWDGDVVHGTWDRGGG